ncbi:hypothetical protein H1W37_19995 [Stappia taiwanensis]|uniref:Uncharacterized protein n=1 Tax=Stappia taiwanensis TaxID=992267 RepID=A0A838XU35_9HYPH|nr:hypothetical protein [Stappia taiwanensis]MBA4613945.1 hypothetical protein [Stappia taiwanensis]
MASSGSEKRQKNRAVGVRLEDELFDILTDRAARVGLRRGTYAYQVLAEHLVGADPVARIARNRVIVSEEDRRVVAEFSRHAANLAGSLIEAARAARLGRMKAYHQLIERLIADLPTVREAVYAIQRAIK